MKMKKTFAGIIASIVAISAMATSMVSAADIAVDKVSTANATTVTFGTIKVPTGFTDGSLTFEFTQANADGVTGTVVDLLSTAANKAACNFTVSGTLAQTATGAILETTDKFTFTDVTAADVTSRVATLVVPTPNVDVATAFEIRDLKISVANVPANFDASKVKITLTELAATTTKAAATVGTVSAIDTTYTIGLFPLLASEVKDAAVNGATAKITFKATTVDKSTIKVTSSQSRQTYSVDVAKGATSASIALPKEAFSAGVTNTLTFDASAVTVTGATLSIAPAAVTTTAAVTTAKPAVTTAATTAATTVPSTSQPKTGSAAPVALAIIPVALAAAFVAKKKA